MEQDRDQEKIVAVVAGEEFKPVLEEVFRYSGGIKTAFFSDPGTALAALGEDRIGVMVCADSVPENTDGLPFPVIAVTRPGFETDRIAVPPKDRFPVPFRPGALLDRVMDHMARGKPTGPSGDIAIGPWRLLPEEGFLRRADGKTVRLTEKEKNILMTLHANRGNTVTRKALLDSIWEYKDGVETHTLETHVYRLRKKIEQDPANPAILLTEETGYRLTPSGDPRP